MGNCLAAPAIVNHAKGGRGPHARKLFAIQDRFGKIEEVQGALRKAGLKSSEVRLVKKTMECCSDVYAGCTVHRFPALRLRALCRQ